MNFKRFLNLLTNNGEYPNYNPLINFQSYYVEIFLMDDIWRHRRKRHCPLN